MITPDKVAELLSKRIETFLYADGVIGTIVDGVYSFAMPDEIERAEQVTGRPAAIAQRSVLVSKLYELGGLDIAEHIGYEYTPYRWLDDVWLGVCRATEREQLDIKPLVLWSLYISDECGRGLTAKMLTRRLSMSERHARRYIGKLQALDTAIRLHVARRDKAHENSSCNAE